MAITNILASGSTAATSSDQTVAAGASVNLLVTGTGAVTVEMKNAGGTYRSIGSLSGASDAKSGASIVGPITYRVRRSAGQTAGCDVVT